MRFLNAVKPNYELDSDYALKVNDIITEIGRDLGWRKSRLGTEHLGTT